CPLADGGEGTLSAIVYSLKGKTVSAATFNALMKPIQAHYGQTQLPEKNSALIEMALTSGLSLIPAEDRNPMNTTSYGTGRLVADAILQGATTIRITLGGSATVDGGLGFLQALGVDLITKSGPLMAGAAGRHLSQVTAIEFSNSRKLLDNKTLIGLTDVQAPLLGPQGAARLYAPQKGASPSDVEELEKGLAHFSKILSAAVGRPLADEAGTGAAGGLGLAILALGGRLENGFDFVAQTLNLENQIRDCDLILTGEGRLDDSSRQGKVPVGVARLAKAQKKPCVAIVGALDPGLDWLKQEGFSKVMPLFDSPFTAPDDPRKEQVNQKITEAIKTLFSGAQKIYV
ncbi:MAG TPA: glycerate kinase, partial [bacterium]|nr:glycerate kinase [bacterium]